MWPQFLAALGEESQPVTRQSEVWYDKNTNKSFQKGGQKRGSLVSWGGQEAS